jgi:hypothetical protein
MNYDYKIGDKVWYFYQGKIHSGYVERKFKDSLIINNRGVARRWVRRTFNAIFECVNNR